MSLPAQVSVTEVVALLEQGSVLIDVREVDETRAGRAPQAVLNPMLSFDLHALPDNTPLLVICHSGGRSQQVTQALLQRGYDASNVVGGMLAWAAAGLPVIDDRGQPGVVA